MAWDYFRYSRRKQQLIEKEKTVSRIIKAIEKRSNLSQITQSLNILEGEIKQLKDEQKKLGFDADYEANIKQLNQVRAKINEFSLKSTKLITRKELIIESKNNLEKDKSMIDVSHVKALYEKASSLIPNLQKTFEDTLNFHNQMIENKIEYITKDLRNLEQEIENLDKERKGLLTEESHLSTKLHKNELIETLNEVVKSLSEKSQKRGTFLERQEQLQDQSHELQETRNRLAQINSQIEKLDESIENNIALFNRYFAEISNKLYGEKFILSSKKNNRGYELNISALTGNLGTGKKKGQIAAFDLAYIQFAEKMNIKHLNFILHDQIETVHGNQIVSLLTEIVPEINCQYIASVLADKLPPDIGISKYEILSLSQNNKLFKIPD